MDALTTRLHEALEGIEPAPGALERTYGRVAARRRRRARGRAAGAAAAIGAVAAAAVIALPMRTDTASATTVRLAGSVVDLTGGGRHLWALTCTQRCDRPLESRGALTSIDARTGEAEEVAKLRSPQAIAVGGRSVWTADFADSTVTHFDADTGRRIASIRLTLPHPVAGDDRDFVPSELTADAEGVWVATARGYVAHVDGTSNRVDSMLETAKDSTGPLTAAGNVLWIAEGVALARLDQDSGKLTRVAIEGPDGRRLSIGAFAQAGGSLWAAGEWAERSRDVTGHEGYTVGDAAALVELDPVTGEIRHRSDLPRGTFLQGRGPGRLWLAQPQRRRLFTFDPATRRIVATGRSRLHGALVPVSSRRAWVVRSAHLLARVETKPR
jgi:hypothetical protein